jgi:hypothetical protein
MLRPIYAMIYRRRRLNEVTEGKAHGYVFCGAETPAIVLRFNPRGSTSDLSTVRVYDYFC